MSEWLDRDNTQWLLMGAAVLLLLLVWAVYRRRRRPSHLQRVLGEIGFDRIDSVLLPNADEGEIQIDHLLLTSRGLLVVDIKDVKGKVFGSDKMSEWTVISSERRFTFSNPQPALFDRVAAVRHVVRQVPVEGRILFLDGAEFTKGTPGQVTTLDDLQAEFGEPDKAAAKVKVEAFKPHWDLVRKQALGAEVEQILSRRNA